MVLSDIDRKLLQRCLHRKPHAWEDFVDRFLGLVLHVIRHTAKTRTLTLTTQDEEDLASEFFVAVVSDDFAILRRFRGESSLATYLTVVARRIVIRHLLRQRVRSHVSGAGGQYDSLPDVDARSPDGPTSDHEEVERLMQGLSGYEAEVVRLYHLEGKSYREISAVTGMPENSIGPTLSRARARLRQADVAAH